MKKTHSFSGIIVRYQLVEVDPVKVDPVEVDPVHKPLDDELHVNLWEIGNERSCPFMDIGVMISERHKVKSVVLDVPWEVSLGDLNDLGAKLNGEKSVAAIFNEVVHYDGFAEGNFANISFRRNGKDEKHFSLLRLDSQSFNIKKIFLGDDLSSSRITIMIPPIINSVASENKRVSAYIRFRIRNIPRSIYSVNFIQNDRALISSSTATRIIDFRINVLRGVPDELMNSASNLIFPQKLKCIHCFLTTIRDEECISVSKYYNGYRSLMDEDIWNEYIKLDITKGISEVNSVRYYLGYQWTAKSKENDDRVIKDLIVLGRLSKTKSNLLSIIRFMFVVILLGSLGSGLWDYIKNIGIDNDNLINKPIAANLGWLLITLVICFIDVLWGKVKKTRLVKYIAKCLKRIID